MTARAISDQFDVREGRYPSLIRPVGGNPKRAFGGHIAGLMLSAAYQSVPDSMSIHHLHVEFLKPGQVGPEVFVTVDTISDGRSVSRRRIDLGLRDQPGVATMIATFNTRRPDAPEFQVAMPRTGAPEAFPPERVEPVEVRRWADPDDPSRQQSWLRPTVRPLSPDPRLHECTLLFMSDFTILWPTLAVHGGDALTDRHRALGTVSHTMYFHRYVPADGWLLYDQSTPTTSAGLGHGEGRLFTEGGILAASVIQVGLLRPSAASQVASQGASSVISSGEGGVQ